MLGLLFVVPAPTRTFAVTPRSRNRRSSEVCVSAAMRGPFAGSMRDAVENDTLDVDPQPTHDVTVA